MVEEKKKAGPHNVVMEDRKRLTVTGVTEIDSFDEQTVVLFCDTGELAIRGEGLHINRIDVDAGELNLEGVRIDALSYADNLPSRGGIWGKLFRWISTTRRAGGLHGDHGRGADLDIFDVRCPGRSAWRFIRRIPDRAYRGAHAARCRACGGSCIFHCLYNRDVSVFDWRG